MCDVRTVVNCVAATRVATVASSRGRSDATNADAVSPAVFTGVSPTIRKSTSLLMNYHYAT